MSANENTLAARLLRVAVEHADRPALYINNELYTYKELLRMAASVCAQLDRTGAPGRIGVYCSETAATYASIFALFISGRTYVPLSSRLPSARIKKLADECGLTLVLSSQPLEPGSVTVITADLDADVSGIHQNVSESLAYIMFTSGTTGHAKGVPVSHTNLEAFFSHFDRHFDFDHTDRFLQPFDFGFDMSLFSMLLAWRSGACACPVAQEGSRPLQILATIDECQVTVAPMVPTILTYAERFMDELRLTSLRYTFFAGDRLLSGQASMWKQKCPSCRVFNCYGPTEATIVCSSHEFDPVKDDSGDVLIGSIFGSLQYLLLDESGAAHAGGGELCLSGEQVIAGYLNNRDAGSFIDIAGRKYYRTGDLARVRKNGELDFAGRADRQIKIQGHRVEPAEVEQHIVRLTGLRTCVVATGENATRQLTAFIEGTFDEKEVFRVLLERLPRYMIPSRLLQIEQFPLTANSKVDVNELAAIYHERFNT